MKRFENILIVPGLLIFVVTCFWGAKATNGTPVMDLTKLLPKEIDGWSTDRPDELYDRDTIFDYMNGAGEIYLGFGFRKLWVREYGMSSEAKIVIEVYDMSTSEDAFGIYTHDTDGETIDIGQNAVYSGGLIRFWKNFYFVRLLAEKETDKTKAALKKIGALISEGIQETGRPPTILNILPREGLLEDQVKYFHNHILLAVHYYLADTNILNLNLETEVVLGTYVKNKNKIRLLLIGYPDAKEASKAYVQFNKIYFSDKPGGTGDLRIEKVERNEFAGVCKKNRFLILVFEASDDLICTGLISSTLDRLED